MIKINLIRGKHRELSLGVGKFKDLISTDSFRERSIYLIPVVGLTLVVGELAYLFKLKADVSSLEKEVQELRVKNMQLKKKFDKFALKKRELQNRIRFYTEKINYLDSVKEAILYLNSYHREFNKNVIHIHRIAPDTIWFRKFAQYTDFDKVSVTIDLNSYDIRSISRFMERMGKEFDSVSIGEIKRGVNKVGIAYYTVSIEANRSLAVER